MVTDSDAINADQAPVQLFLHPTESGHAIAEARLNNPATLNALSLDMIEIMFPALETWAHDERVVAVILSGSGERAFSAGGERRSFPGIPTTMRSAEIPTAIPNSSEFAGLDAFR